MNQDSNSSPTLQVSDLEAMVRFIDYVAGEGVLKGWDVIDEVRDLRNRLFAFVSSISTAQNQPQEAAGDDVPDSPAAE